MRGPVFVLTILFATAAGAGAQTTPIKVIPPTTPTTATTTTKLDEHLKKWEMKMREVQSLAAKVNRKNQDKTFGTTTYFTGTAQYAKSGSGSTALNMAALELKQVGKTDFAEKVVCTGTYLYQFFPPQKEIRAYAIAKPKGGQVGDDSFLGFLFGMKSEEAKKLYTMTLFKEDAYYVYIDITPRTAAGKADFARARMVLNKDSYLPRQLWFEEANGSEITWDLPQIQSGMNLDRRLFDAPRTPPGWKLVPVNATASSANPPPRVIRPSK